MRHRVVTGVVAALVLVGAAPAASAQTAPEPALSAVPSEPAVGSTLSLTGTRFFLPAPDQCTLHAFDRRWRCVVDEAGAGGALVLADVEGVQPGAHDVEVCVPSCEFPWAGSARGTLVVEDDPDVGDAPDDVGSAGTSDGPAPEPESVADGAGPPGASDDGPPPEQRDPAPALDQGTSGTDPFGLRRPPVPLVIERQAPTVVTTRAPVLHRLMSLSVSVAVHQLELLPERTSPAGTVVVTAPELPDSVRTTACELQWDGASLGSCTAQDDGTLSGELVVPVGAGGRAHDVAACRPACATQGARRASLSVPVAPAAPPGPPPRRDVVVPNVTGVELQEAQELITGASLVVGRTVGRGRVTAQSPGGGTSVPPGTAVDLVLAAAPPSRTVEVPDLTGLTVDEARQQLAAVGLLLEDPPEGDGVVAGQVPDAGALVDAGSSVRIALDTPAGLLSWLVAAAVAALTLLTGAAAASVRSWRQLRAGRVVLQPVPDLRPVVRTEVEVPAQRPPPLRLLARADTRPDVRTEVFDDHDG